MPPPSNLPAAACSQWDVDWHMEVCSNKMTPLLSLHCCLRIPDSRESAVYWYEYRESGYYFPRRASVDGSVNGDSFEVTAYWDNGTIGVYTAK
jgi:hypothetical protein